MGTLSIITGPMNFYLGLEEPSMHTYSSQSTAKMRPMSSIGSPTACSTITMVTKPAWGIPAAPMDAIVAVRLQQTRKKLNSLTFSKIPFTQNPRQLGGLGY